MLLLYARPKARLHSPSVELSTPAQIQNHRLLQIDRSPLKWTVPDQTREPLKSGLQFSAISKLVRGVILPQLGCVSTKFVAAIKKKGEGRGGLKTHQFAGDYGRAEICSRHEQGKNSIARKVADNCGPPATLSSSKTSPGKLCDGVRQLKDEIKFITLWIS